MTTPQIAGDVGLMRIRTRCQTIRNVLANILHAPYCGLCWLSIQQLALTNTCMHQFCFDCLSLYTVLLTVCPLCHQPFETVLCDITGPYAYRELTVADMRAERLTQM